MKLNKKIIIALFILVIVTLILCLFNKKDNVLCELKKDSINTKIDIRLNKNITFSYNYLFKSMDETVDKFDSFNSYLKIINKLDGVNSKIDQVEKNINYSINIDLTNIKEEDYKLLNITEIIKLKNKKEIMDYYEKQGFACEII